MVLNMNERQTAFKILCRIEKDKAYANLLLDAAIKETESSVASGFLTALVYGVIERKLTLDYLLSQHLKKPLKRLSPEAVTILRMGAYQLKFMDKVPASAAVNESVKLSKKNGCSYASGLINSVLRRVKETEISYPETGNKAYDFSIRYSCPEPLVQHFIEDYGVEDTEGILKTSFEIPPTTVRVNTVKTDIESFKTALLEEGIEATEVGVPNMLNLSKASGLENLESYKKGLFHLQDAASARCVEALSLEPGQVLLDLCAAPGGKSFTAAEHMQNKGEILSFDLYEARVERMKKGAERLGLQVIKASAADASQENEALLNSADRVLCDVPCSGFGTIRRKPEIRYKDLASIDKLPELQYNILENGSKYLKENGILVYSTCTLNRAENDAVCDRFLNAHPEFEALGEYTTLMPHKDKTDGFFFARFGRRHDG